jgi:hypothetical protein
VAATRQRRALAGVIACPPKVVACLWVCPAEVNMRDR